MEFRRVLFRSRQRIGVERSAQRLRRLDHPVIALRQLRLLAVENRQIVVDHGKKLEAEAEFLAAAVHALQRFGAARRGAGALAEILGRHGDDAVDAAGQHKSAVGVAVDQLERASWRVKEMLNVYTMVVSDSFKTKNTK